MDIQAAYKELNVKVGLANSVYLNDIWKILCTHEEAVTANLLPGTVEDISNSSGKSPDETETILLSLFSKGVAFKSPRDGKVQYKLAKNLVQFHDACLLWDGATDEFYELWTRVMDEEFAGLLKSLPADFALPSFMRVIPINETIESKSTVLTFEECKSIIDSSEKVAVVKCPCRLSQKRCDAPLESCLQVNRGAEYVIDRGHGREITRDEAIDILKQSEEAGLVHMTENKAKGNAICNCCSCCCEMFRLVKFSQKSWVLSPSRYTARVSDECTACSACVDICPVDAISINDIAEINEEICIGCGLCATTCPVDAISLAQVRPEEHIPAGKK
ncbi:MAG: 4Fe-4S dicluster domain-containing protein [bacterium]|nr:4Fe-4S dicluster domain-containing protein [bacterium]